jgi:hypothetical protein
LCSSGKGRGGKEKGEGIREKRREEKRREEKRREEKRREEKRREEKRREEKRRGEERRKQTKAVRQGNHTVGLYLPELLAFLGSAWGGPGAFSESFKVDTKFAVELLFTN